MLNIIIILLIYLNILILLEISPIQKIFILILLYILGSLIMIILENNYIGLTYIIIYVGAIAILF
jgi:NADH-ubiquinone oxidoreductase chain 6